MTGSVLVVHPDAEQIDRIQTLIQPLGLAVRRAHDFMGAAEGFERARTELVICSDIEVPEHDPVVVEGVRRMSSRLPVIVLVNDSSEVECPKATRLLTGLQQYLVWPAEAADLLPVARALLRTFRYLGGPQSSELSVMRTEQETRLIRETLSALRATGGNVTRAAELLKLSRSGLNYRLKQLGLR